MDDTANIARMAEDKAEKLIRELEKDSTLSLEQFYFALGEIRDCIANRIQLGRDMGECE